tara:strand:- start:1149 stop:2630 length:1482 start_codon:yes stop_codon:yes gene_type:complete
MANQGILAQNKQGNSNAVLYECDVSTSASAALTIANDGTGAAYNVAIKDYDQDLAVGASTYLLHKGDIITGYRFTVGTAITTAAGLTGGTLLTNMTNEKTAKFESFYTPDYTEIFVKSVLIRAITLESTTGTFAVGETLTEGSGGNTAVSTIYATTSGSGSTIVYVGPTTLSGSANEYAAGDSVTSSGGATGTISTGGIATGVNSFVFSTTTAGGTYDMYKGTTFTQFGDRTYRFNVADASMASKDFHVSVTVNGEWGPDGTAGNSDDGTEYTTGKTTNGTPGNAGAYVQYDWSANASPPSNMYFYEGTTGTAANSSYGGSDRLITISATYEYTSFWVYDIEGSWTNSTDTFTFNGVTYTVTGQTTSAYGYVRDYTGTSLKVIKGKNSADFTTSHTFLDNPKLGTATRTTCTISSITTATTAVEDKHWIAVGVALGNNAIAKINQLVIGPGERLIIKNATANNVATLVGFEDASTAFVTRNFDPNATVAGGSG